MSSSAAPLPAPVRIVSGLDASGASTVVYDSPVTMKVDEKDDGTASAFGQIWATHTAPADNSSGIDEGANPVEGIVHKGGSVFRVVDIGPHGKAPMHYTHSIDYAVVLAGEIVMGTSDGKRTTIKQGSVIVQTGQLHDWVNETDAWTRLIFVSIESKPLQVNGKPLDGLHLH